MMRINRLADGCGIAALAGSVAALLLAGGQARAADLTPPPPPAPASFSWSGLYVGANVGYAGATVSESASGAATGTGSASMPAGIGGGQIGYNYQIGAVVLGFEADFDGNMATKSSAAFGGVSGTNQIPWLATLRGRAGVAFDRYLVYATAGGVAGELNSNVNVNGIGSASTANTFSGWTAGGGLEVGITDRLSARVEYLYLASISDITAAQVGPPFATVTSHVQDNLVRVGLNYRFPTGP